MYLQLGTADNSLRDNYDVANINAFLMESYKLFSSVAGQADLYGKALFEPLSDKRFQELAQWITQRHTPRRPTKVIVHVATYVYEVGGHTRLIEDIARALPDYDHILIMTDITGAYARGVMTLGALVNKFDSLKISVRWLPPGELMSRATMLSAMINRISPAAVFVNVHPYDVVGYSGISGESAPKVILLHHADHYPALGSARQDYIHVDLTEHCHEQCCKGPNKQAIMLDMSVPDVGIATPSPTGPFTCAVAGTVNKFTDNNSGPSYPQLLVALLQSGVDLVHHIGTFDQPFVDNIRQTFGRNGLDAERIVFHSYVPSLAKALKQISPHFLLNSHPLGGGKGIVEGLSLGLPYVHFQPPEKDPFHGWMTRYGACEVVTDLALMPEAMKRIKENGTAMGAANRKLYEERYTPEAFERTVRQLLA